MEAAARSSSHVRRAKRPGSTTATRIDVLPPVGIRADGGSSSHIRRAKPPWRRRTAQIRIPSRRAKTLRPHLLLPDPLPHPYAAEVRPAYSPLDLDDLLPDPPFDPDLDDLLPDPPFDPLPNPYAAVVRPAHSPRGLDNSKKLQPLSLPDYQRAKHARTDLPCRNWRDWANIDDGPAGLIAERVLAYDVADFVRFRAVCRPWRQCSSQPSTHTGLDRRFHPWRWTMLRDELAAPDRRCFLNTSTGECIKVDIPELRDYELLACTPEGLLVLARKPPCTTTICMLNPLTRNLIQLPPLSKLVPSEYHDDMLPERDGLSLNYDFKAWGSGIANDDSTVVLCFPQHEMLGMAKPGDDHWTLLEYDCSGITSAPIMFEGRFYSINRSGVMVLETGPPRLEVAAKLNLHICRMADTFHLVNNCGELMLVHCHLRAGNQWGRFYDIYRVDLDTGTVLQVKSLGGAGRALFLGKLCSLSVSLEVFPSGSMSADTIYLSSDQRRLFEVAAFRLADGSDELPNSFVPRPHTLTECLSQASNI